MKYRTKCALTVAAGFLLSGVFFILDTQERQMLAYLDRPGQGEEDTEQIVEVRMGGRKYELSVPLYALPYEKAELQRRLEEGAEALESLFLNENSDLEHIYTSVSMPPQLPNSEISVQWYLDSWDYIQTDGTVENLELEEAVPVQVQAVLSCEDESLVWQREVTVMPQKELSGEQTVELLKRQLVLQQSGSGKRIALPSSAGQEAVQWYLPAEQRWKGMLALTLAAAFGLFVGKQKDEEKLIQKKEQSMQRDYPDIVSRLSLYMGAGVSMRNAWERIVENYEQKMEKEKNRRPAYEEMRTALHEMQSGVSEAAAYERFGTRCRVSSYLKLGTLLSQNLRKGTKNLAALLAEESREAFENRKAHAKRIGEECESKLLFPMLLLLLSVLIMVMYPAVTSFQMG